MANKPSHPYHLIEPSAKPFLMSFALLILSMGGILFMHDKPHGGQIFSIGLIAVIMVLFFWWKDVITEGVRDKAHNEVVKKGLKLGMVLFIISEFMFFFALFFSFFKASIFPVDIVVDIWPEKSGIWPPEGIKTFDPWSIPFINTLILLLSGTTVTWAYIALENNNKRDLVRGLALTVLLGVIFSGFQIYEYYHAAFSLTDGVYAANFYLATGFHGIHVVIGTIFLFICLVRARRGAITPKAHLGFQFACWYWHFVDIVWIFLFIWVYIWGA